MSQKELDQIELFEKLDRKEIEQAKASRLLGLSVRQIKRKLRQFRTQGVGSLVHKGRGKPSNNKVAQKLVDKTIQLVISRYPDFGPTFAQEKLVENHNLKLSVSKLRQEMIKVGLWQPKSKKHKVLHSLRERRPCFGELVQIDGSPYDWFEGRAPYCNLNAMIDDATSNFVLEFSASETTQGYFSLMSKYVALYGLPRAIYSDRHSIFQLNQPTQLEHKKPSVNDQEHNTTQFGRAMEKLDVTLICANSPQAKGRVERLNRNLQNRLVKEMRLRQISSIQQANIYLPEFTRKYVKKFAIKPQSSVNMHKQPSSNIDLSLTLCVQNKRVLSRNLTFQFQDTIYQVVSKKPNYTLRRTKVTVCQHHTGILTVLDNKGNKLRYIVFKKVRRKLVASSKQLNQLVDVILAHQATDIEKKRNPWESDPKSLDGDNLYYKPAGAI